MQIGLQTFTIRKDLKNKDSMVRAFKEIKSLGINSIEIARISFDRKTVKLVNEVAQNLDIKVKASQFKLKEIESDLEFTIDTHKMWNCNLMAVSVVPIPYLIRGLEGFKRLADKLNVLGSKTKKEGIQLLNHHHHFEFGMYKNKFKNYHQGFDVLNESIDRNAVKFMLDTYWLWRSGYEPASFIEKMSGNVKVVHLRDYYLKAGLITPNISDTYLGNGTLDFQKIISAAEIAGVEQLSIEQETQLPYNHLKKSIKYLRSISMDHHLK